MLRIGVCGTTHNTVQCAEALRVDSRFSIEWVVTPTPRPIGRKQLLTPSALDGWAAEHHIPVYHVEKSLKPLQNTLLTAAPIDYLLVVDFGYLVPQWLIDLPSICPVNIHPSDLPKYRGSSPAQYAILYGETDSAVAIMRLTAGLDEGPIIARLPFPLQSTETQVSYYRIAFDLASQSLPDTLVMYSENRTENAQPEQSPTPIAKRFSREDGFIPYEILEKLELGTPILSDETAQLSPILQEVLEHQPHTSVAQLVERAVRALSPWPGVWTTVPQYKGRTDVRQKILTAHLQGPRLVIDQSQFDGEALS